MGTFDFLQILSQVTDFPGELAQNPPATLRRDVYVIC